VIVQQNERKLLEANQRLAWLQTQEDKRVAAEYLVEQMRVVNEEKQSLLYDNQNLQQSLSETEYEYQKLARDLKDFMCFRQGQEEYSPVDPIAQNTQRLNQRVEELEDLVIEFKSKQSASDVTELKHLVAQLELENLSYIKHIKQLETKRLASKELFAGNEMHQSYITIMKEREKVIEQLHQQLKKLSDQNVLKVQATNQSFGQPTGAYRSGAQSISSDAKATYGDPNGQMDSKQSHGFDDEKLKDAVNFKNMMQTMTQSRGFANIHSSSQQIEENMRTHESRNVFQGGASAPNEKPPSINTYESVQHPATKEQVFSNFSKNDRDQWLLSQSQE